MTFQFDQSGLLYDQPDFYLGPESAKYRTAEISFIKDVARLLGAPETNLHRAEDIYNFELSLARVCIRLKFNSHHLDWKH